MQDWLQWLLAGACFLVTVVLEAEVAVMFIVAGLIGIAYYGSLFRRKPAATAGLAVAAAAGPSAAAAAVPATAATVPATLGQLMLFFLKGRQHDVRQRARDRAVPRERPDRGGALARRARVPGRRRGRMISPGPVVITATFVGYIVAGFWGSLVSTIGIFLPSFLLVLIVAPVLMRHRNNLNVQAS